MSPQREFRLFITAAVTTNYRFRIRSTDPPTTKQYSVNTVCPRGQKKKTDFYWLYNNAHPLRFFKSKIICHVFPRLDYSTTITSVRILRFDCTLSDGYSSGDLTGRQPLNEDSGLGFNRELTYDRSNLDTDSEFNYNGAIECVPGTPQCKNLELAKNDRNAVNSRHDDRGDSTEDSYHCGNAECDHGRFEANSYYWSYGQSGRSVESFVAGEVPGTAAAGPHAGGDDEDARAFGPATLGWETVRKMAAVDAIVAEEHRRNGGGGGGGNLLDVESPLLVKKSAVKVSKQNYVSFQAAQVDDMKSGRLEYLSVDVAKDAVYVECAFDRLTANGTFKTNLRHTKAGQFSVDMGRVSSNVTASFHKGRAAIGPAAFATIATRVTTADRQDDVAAVEGSVRETYGGVLARAVSAEVYNSTHKGMVARLKAEANAPFGDRPHAGPFDVDWTEGDLHVRVSADGGHRSSRKPARRRIESASYTRLPQPEDAYRMRFDVDLKALRWTGDLTGAWRGQRFRAPAADFELDRVKVRAVVVKSASDGRTCRKVETDVRTHGFRYALNGQLPSDDVRRTLERELPGFVKRSFENCLRNSVAREMCDGKRPAN